jgi:hypothetical protein
VARAKHDRDVTTQIDALLTDDRVAAEQKSTADEFLRMSPWPKGEVVREQDDLFWVTFRSAYGSEPWGCRPALILQHDRFNRSRLNTVVVVAITSNLRYASLPGNVRCGKAKETYRKHA